MFIILNPNFWLNQYSYFPIILTYANTYAFISDERDRIQKKTFTKWCNQHLRKVTKPEGEQPECEKVKVDKRNTLKTTGDDNNHPEGLSDDDDPSDCDDDSTVRIPEVLLL